MLGGNIPYTLYYCPIDLVKSFEVYDKIQNKVPKKKFVVNSCFCMKEMW